LDPGVTTDSTLSCGYSDIRPIFGEYYGDPYCVQVSHTDAYVWSLTQDMLPVDPHSRVSPGVPCLDEGARWTDPDGRPIVCEKTRNGRMAGDLVWMFVV
jgi:hypothetical protein